MHLSGRLFFFVDNIAISLNLTSKAGPHFAPWGTFNRLLSQDPLLVAVALAAMGHALFLIRRQWREQISWEGVFLLAPTLSWSPLLTFAESGT